MTRWRFHVLHLAHKGRYPEIDLPDDAVPVGAPKELWAGWWEVSFWAPVPDVVVPPAMSAPPRRALTEQQGSGAASPTTRKGTDET